MISANRPFRDFGEGIDMSDNIAEDADKSVVGLTLEDEDTGWLDPG